MNSRSGLASLAISLIFWSQGCTDDKASTPDVFPIDGSGKKVLEANDFEYQGSFLLPTKSNGESTAFGAALTHRYRGDTLIFYSMTKSMYVYECAYSGESLAEPYPKAVLGREWGDITGNKRWTKQEGENSGGIYGLYWDSQDELIYWNYGYWYNAGGTENPSLGASKLDDKTGKASAIASWWFERRGDKMTRGGTLAIPSWFAEKYTSGKRLGVGFGGYYSIVSTGPVSMGPALCAIDPPGNTPHLSAIPSQPLLGYPYNATPYTKPNRGKRNTNYTTTYDSEGLGWQPKNGTGYWTWSDVIFQAGIWIDLPNKHGLVFFPTLGTGKCSYSSSERHAEGGEHWWHVYGPMDLAKVANGELTQDEIDAVNTWEVRYPHYEYPLKAYDGNPYHTVSGVTYDAKSKRLFVMLKQAYKGDSLVESFPVVCVYQLRD